MKRIIAAVIMILFASTTFAETRVGRRQERQQKGIARGVKSGELTARETAGLETKEAKLEKEKLDMREDNGGKLTAKDKVKLNRQENRLSKGIYKQKHDAQTQ